MRKRMIVLPSTQLMHQQSENGFYLPPSDNISTSPLFYMEVLTLVFPCPIELQ